MDDDATPKAPPRRLDRWILVAIPLPGAVVAVGGIWVAVEYARTPVHEPTPLATTRAAGADPRVVAEVCRQSFSAPPDGTSPDSPEITDVTVIDRNTVRVRWVDRSRRSDTIIVVARVCESGRMINEYFGNTAGTAEHPLPKATEYVFHGLDPVNAPWCFRVKVMARNDVYSHQRCVSPPR